MGLAAIIPAKGGASRMTLSHVEEVLVRAAGGVTTILTHKDFGASLTVGVLLMDAVDLPHVRLQRAALREGLLAQLTLVGPDPCNEAHTHTHLRGGARGTDRQRANERQKKTSSCSGMSSHTLGHTVEHSLYVHLFMFSTSN